MAKDHSAGEALTTPWKVWNEVARWLILPWVRLDFALNGVAWGKGWRVYGSPILQKHRNSRMQFGAHLQLRSSPHSNPLGPNRPVILATWRPGAVLELGDHFAITGGTICAAERIVVGHGVTVGANTIIVDTDFHPLGPEHRHRNPNQAAPAPITIEDDVFVGMQCLVLKGVTLGRGCVIGAGSVVTRDVPPGALAAGNPARVIDTVAI
jgi:acetyltransferase-like isoleucine patch superfamily enzyme